MCVCSYTIKEAERIRQTRELPWSMLSVLLVMTGSRVWSELWLWMNKNLSPNGLMQSLLRSSSKSHQKPLVGDHLRYNECLKNGHAYYRMPHNCHRNWALWVTSATLLVERVCQKRVRDVDDLKHRLVVTLRAHLNQTLFQITLLTHLLLKTDPHLVVSLV